MTNDYDISEGGTEVPTPIYTGSRRVGRLAANVMLVLAIGIGVQWLVWQIVVNWWKL